MEAATQGRRSLLGKEQEMEDWILGVSQKSCTVKST